MSAPERQGSLMRWQAECGHWMVVYSKEPTPTQCPDCRDELREELERTFCINPSLSADSDSFDPDEFPSVPAPLARLLEAACDDYGQAAKLVEEAQDQYDAVESTVRNALDEYLPKAERLSMPESS